MAVPPDIPAERPRARRPSRLRLRESFRQARAEATTEEKVRGFLAIFFVLILIALVINTPDGQGAINAIASAKTISIAVIAFYFGLHKGTPHAQPEGTISRANE